MRGVCMHFGIYLLNDLFNTGCLHLYRKKRTIFTVGAEHKQDIAGILQSNVMADIAYPQLAVVAFVAIINIFNYHE